VRSLVYLLLTVTISIAEVMHISGFVYDPYGEPATGAQVTLAHQNYSTTTDGNGFFLLDETTALLNASNANANQQVAFTATGIQLQLSSSMQVELSIVKLNGQILPLYSGNISAGSHTIPFSNVGNLAKGVYILQSKIGTHYSAVKFISGESSLSSISPSPIKTEAVTRSRAFVSVDTLLISKNGHRTRTVELSSYSQFFNTILLSKLGRIYALTELLNDDTLTISRTNVYDWTDVAWGGDNVNDGVTAVIIDSAASTKDTLVSAILIRKSRENDTSDYKTAAIGTYVRANIMSGETNPLSMDMGRIEITYMVEKSTDTLAFYLAPAAYEGSFHLGFVDSSKGIKRDVSMFRAVLTSGAENPGIFVSDTISLHDFSLKYGQDDIELMRDLGYTKNDDGNVYLDENDVISFGNGESGSIKNIMFLAFEGESEEVRNDTIALKIRSIRVAGDFYPDTVNGLELIEASGWLPIHDSLSSVNTVWNNGTPTINIKRGASNESENKWAYAGAIGVLNSNGNLGQVSTIRMTYIVPDEGDTVALSLERGERIGAGDKDDNRYGSFRIVIPYAADSLDSLFGFTGHKPGDTVSIDYSIFDFVMNWGDDPTAPYQYGDTLTHDFLKEVNSIGIFSEKDNGTNGSAKDGDSVSFKLLELVFIGNDGLSEEILPLTTQQK